MTILGILFCAVLCAFAQEQPSAPEYGSLETTDTLDQVLDFLACIDGGKWICEPSPDFDVSESNAAEHVHVQGWKHAILKEDVTIPEAKPTNPVFIDSVQDLHREVPNEEFPIRGKPSNPVFVESDDGLNREVTNEELPIRGKPINPVFIDNDDGLNREVTNEELPIRGKPINPVFIDNDDGLNREVTNEEFPIRGKPINPVFVDNLNREVPNEKFPIPGKPRYPYNHKDVQDLNREVPKEHVTAPVNPSYPARSPYFTICEKFHMKMSELEHGHEELKSLKFQFLERMKYYSSSISTDCKKGESMVIKILDLIIHVAEKMKEEYGHFTHDKYPLKPDHHLDPGFVGSYRGIPGVHYPNYTEVPITSFSCSGRRVPGFYVDLETRCQVFHVCYEHRRESFLCPLGTIFNQALLVCDYWYSSTCSDIQVDSDTDYNEAISVDNTLTVSEETGSSIDSDTFVGGSKDSEEELKTIVKFLPVKAKVWEFPKGSKGKAIVSSIDDVKEVASKILGGIVTSSKGIVASTMEAIEGLNKSGSLTKTAKLPEPQVARVHQKIEKPSEPKVYKVLPRESKVEEVADKIFSGIVTTGKQVVSKTRKTIQLLPDPKVLPKVVKLPEQKVVPVFSKVKLPEQKVVPVFSKVKLPEQKVFPFSPKVVQPFPKVLPKMKPLPLGKVKSLKSHAIPWIKLKMVSAGALPLKVNAAAALPFAKAKVAPAKFAIPLAKAKLAKASVPYYKVKALPSAAAKPVAKTKLVKSKLASVPVVKVKKMAKAVLPFHKVAAAVKPKLVIPVVKGKLVKSTVLSPFTKKALAVGYLKLLKAKKLGLVF